MSDPLFTPAFDNTLAAYDANVGMENAQAMAPRTPGIDYAQSLAASHGDAGTLASTVGQHMKYAPAVGRADKHSSNIPSVSGSIASNGRGGSNQ